MLAYFDAGENELLLKDLVLRSLQADTSYTVSDELTEGILVNIKTAIAEKTRPPVMPVVPLYQRSWFRTAAVACFLGAAVMAGLLLSGKKERPSPRAALVHEAKREILPGKDAAKLILADGSVIVLDSAGNGALAQQGATGITKKNGEISYDKQTTSPAVLYNTLATARGNQYQVKLADGSKVWLNAASSIRFPTAFTGKERRVEITGEVYFEVSHDVARPFIVQISGPGGADGGEVKVLGTHFNVHAYEEDGAIKTTLLEGAVQFIRKGNSRILRPGQQSVAGFTKNDIDITTPSLEKEMAWKNGQFLFDGDPIEHIMRQISRWYDIDVVYEGPVSTETFSGVLSRNSSIDQVLKVLEVGGLTYRLNGKRIIVTQRPH